MRKILLLFNRRTQIKYENELGKKSGIMFMDTPRADNQNVLIMVLLKALIIFLAMMGSIDCYMTGFGITYDAVLIASAVAAISIIFAFANTNIIATALVYGVIVYYLSFYVEDAYETISSGITAIVNMSYDLIREKYKFPEVDGFTEILMDRTTTVPTVIILASIIFGMMIAIFVCKFMTVIVVMIMTSIPLFVTLFFEGVPSYRSIIMLIGSWLIMAVVKFSDKFGHIRFKNKMTPYYIKGKVFYSQLCDGMAMFQSTFLVVLIAGLITALPYSLLSNNVFDSLVPRSETKADIDNAVRDTMIIAFSNYKNYQITSYVSSGQLGFYGNVQPDFQTDLKVSLVPYTYERTYLRNYIGSNYNYRKNYWSEIKDHHYDKSDSANSTARAIDDNGVSARVQVENVSVQNSPLYMPYYTDMTENEGFIFQQDDVIGGNLGIGQTSDIEYHPLTDQMEDTLTNEYLTDEYRDYVYSNYLQIPKQLKVRISSLCSGEGFNADDENLEQEIADFFQNNYEYDMESGRLPWNTDFVEYFLFENKRGVCAHFATATTLIYRSLGIPARYVEGYAMDYPVIMQGTALEDENVADWITGVVPLSSSVMNFELSDYNAHAWVEVYKDGVGWVTVDTTPYVSEEDVKEETTSKSMGEEIMDYFQELRLKRIEYGSNIEFAVAIIFNVIKVIISFALILAIAYLLLRPVKRVVYRNIAVIRGDRTKAVRFIYEHTRNIAINCNIIAKSDYYRDLAEALVNIGFDEEKGKSLLKLTEKAIYSKTGITDVEYRELKTCYREADRLMLSHISLIKRLIVRIKLIK